MKKYTLSIVMIFILCVPICAQRSKENDSASAYKLSYQLENNQQYAKALAALDTVNKKDKKSYFFYLRNGWLNYLCKKYDESSRWYKKAAKSKPKAIEPFLGRLKPEIELGHWKTVEKIAKFVLRRDSKNYTANCKLADCYYMSKHYSKAVKAYGKILQLYPADMTIKSSLGWSLLNQGKHKQAAIVFEKILLILPSHTQAAKGLELAKSIANFANPKKQVPPKPLKPPKRMPKHH